jgi:hypothetical protein
MHARLCTIVPQVRSAFLRLDSSSHRRLLGNSAAQVKKQVRTSCDMLSSLSLVETSNTHLFSCSFNRKSVDLRRFV